MGAAIVGAGDGLRVGARVGAGVGVGVGVGIGARGGTTLTQEASSTKQIEKTNQRVMDSRS